MPPLRRCRLLRSHLAPAKAPEPEPAASPEPEPAPPSAIAIIDLSAEDGDGAIATRLSEAFERTGFSVVVGAPPPTIAAGAALEAAAREFFAQPEEEKFRVHVDEQHMEAPDGYPGYLEPGHSSVANLLGDFSRPPDAVELLTYKDLHYYENEELV